MDDEGIGLLVTAIQDLASIVAVQSTMLATNGLLNRDGGLVIARSLEKLANLLDLQEEPGAFVLALNQNAQIVRQAIANIPDQGDTGQSPV